MKGLHLFFVLMAISFSTAWGQQIAIDSYSIVIPPNTSPSVQYAAEELKSYLSEISGSEIKIVAEDKFKAEYKNYISLARTDLSQKIIDNDRYKKLADEGYVITHKGNNIFIIGSDKRGTLYGVYDFLESLGIRWLTPKVTHIAKTDKILLPKYKQYIPDMWYRDQLWNNAPDAQWFARMRLNGSFTKIRNPKFGGSWTEKDWNGNRHTIQGLVPFTLAKAHPKWFALKNGKRYRGSNHHVELCMTNPELRKFAAESVCKWIAKNPGSSVFWVTQSDGSNSWCECEKCLAERKAHGGPDRWSANLGSFLSYIAQVVKKRYPHVKLKTLAYSLSKEPPENMKLPDNLIVVLCGPGANWMISDCPANNEFYQNQLAGWRKTGADVQLWSYAGSNFGFWWPFPSWYFIGDNINAAHKAGINATFLQGTFGGYGSGMCEMNAYVTARMLWNPAGDVRDVIEEFTDLYYGPAGQYIRKYMETYHFYVKRNNLGMHHGWGDASSWRKWVTPEIISRAEIFFQKAFDAVHNKPELYKRVQAAYLPILWAKIHLAFSEKGQSVAPKLSTNGKKAIMADIHSFIRIMKANGFNMWRESVRFDPEKQLLSKAKVFMNDMKRICLHNELQAVEIIPALGGRIVSWKFKGISENIFEESSPTMETYPYSGGYEELDQFKLGSPAAVAGYSVEKKSNEYIELSVKLDNALKITREITLTSRGFIVKTEYRNESDKPVNVHLRSHPVLSFEIFKNSKCLIPKKDGRNTIAFWQKNHKFGELHFNPEEVRQNYILLDNVNKNQQLKIGFNSNQLEQIYLYWGHKNSPLPPGVTIELWKSAIKLQPTQKLSLKQVFEIIRNK